MAATATAARREVPDAVGAEQRLHPSARIPWYFVLPALLLYAAFFLVPNLFGAGYSLTQWDGITSPHWVGLHNFREVFNDPQGKSAFLHTIELAACYIVVVNAVGLGLALGLHRSLKSRNFLRALFFAPAAVSPLAVAYVWQFILEPDGPLNSALQTLGLGGLAKPWLGDPHFALWAVLATMVWQFSGYHMVIYLAGLQTIPEELHEAAETDGAGTWRRFRDITCPQLLPAFTISIALSMIGSLKVFDQVIALTSGGPGNATETLATQVYQQAFVNGHYGYSAALALVLAAAVTILAALQLRAMRGKTA